MITLVYFETYISYSPVSVSKRFYHLVTGRLHSHFLSSLFWST